MIGYFEGIDSERGLAWRCADSYSLSLRDFLRLSNREKAPDHSWWSRTRSRLPHEAHEQVFGWVLKLVAERGLLKGEWLGEGHRLPGELGREQVAAHQGPSVHPRWCCAPAP